MEDPRERLERGWAALQQGGFLPAVTACAPLLACPDIETMAEAQLLTGIAWTSAGAWADAEAHLLQVLGSGCERFRGRALYHLAVCYESMHRTDTATAVYEQAIVAYTQTDDLRGLVLAAQNAGWMLTYYGRLAEASGYLDQAEPHLATEALRRQQAVLQAFLLLRMGDPDTALDKATLAMTDDSLPWVSALACYVGAKVALARRQASLARQLYCCGQAHLPGARDTRMLRLYGELCQDCAE